MTGWELPKGGRMNLQIDRDDQAVLVAALDLYQRVRMGQLQHVAEHVTCKTLVDYSPLAHALGALAERHCERYDIPAAGQQARRAHDLWRNLGGGMTDRQADRHSRHSPTNARLESDTP